MIKKSLIRAPLFFIVILIVVPFFFNPLTKAQNALAFTVNHEWAKVWILENGTIDLLYDIKATCISGEISGFYIGQPNGDFTIREAWDEEGNILNAYDASVADNYRVDVLFNPTIKAGESIRFNLTTNVGHMIYEDKKNPGNVGMQFVPNWWENASLTELRVLIVLPQGVTNETVKTFKLLWDNADPDPDEDNKLVCYWERQNLGRNEKVEGIGVSFPEEFVEQYWKQQTFISKYWPVILVLSSFLVIGIVVVTRNRKWNYTRPSLRMETLGVRRGLTAVEASWLLGLPPTKIVTEILYSLIMKRAVWVTTSEPNIRLEVMDPFKDKNGTRETPLRYYEISFLEAVRKDGSLREEVLAKTVMGLRDTVEEKLRGYCRQDTIGYYKSIVEKAWEQVVGAGTTELASKVYNEQLLWLLLDENFQSQTRTVFRDKNFAPLPHWWWFWYWHVPSPTPPTTTPTTAPTTLPRLPGADFADRIAGALENTANNIVTNVERFVDSIIPLPPPSTRTSSEPTHHRSSCACACASCACVCACVSCACACAGGGAH